MKVIGITGGVGSGKSAVLSAIKETYNCKVLLADEIANALKKKGEACYEPLVELLGEGILGKDGEIDNPKMAQVIFGDAKHYHPNLQYRQKEANGDHPSKKFFRQSG